MSRCFPYPPPGYVKNGVSGQAMIESIKLQRRKEREEAKEKKRERKRERKERKKLKSGEVPANINKIVPDVIGNRLPKQREEVEQVKSDVTEEHEQPISSQNRNKRKRQDSPCTESQNNNGQVICIHVSLRKNKASSIEGVCSTFGRTVYPPRPQQPQCRDTNTRTNIDVAVKPSCSIMKGTSLVSSGRSVSRSSTDNDKGPGRNVSGSDPDNKKGRGVEMRYKSLVEDWVAPPLSVNGNSSGELEWLLGTAQRKGKGNSRVERNETCHVSSTLWPKAYFLPSAGMYALPYTIPF